MGSDGVETFEDRVRKINDLVCTYYTAEGPMSKIGVLEDIKMVCRGIDASCDDIIERIKKETGLEHHV